jgi:hypothetical protein
MASQEREKKKKEQTIPFASMFFFCSVLVDHRYTKIISIPI